MKTLFFIGFNFEQAKFHSREFMSEVGGAWMRDLRLNRFTHHNKQIVIVPVGDIAPILGYKNYELKKVGEWYKRPSADLKLIARLEQRLETFEGPQ